VAGTIRSAVTAPRIESLTSIRISLLGPNLAYHLVRLSDRREAEEDWGKSEIAGPLLWPARPVEFVPASRPTVAWRSWREQR
jgi:hypothetical protein